MERVCGAVGEEVVSLLLELRRHSRFAIPWDSRSGMRDDSFREHPLIVDLRSAKRNAFGEKIDAPKVLEPFLSIIRGNSANAVITAAALSSVDRLLRELCLAATNNCAEVEAIGEAIDDIVEGLLDCKFEPTDAAKDELVLVRKVKVAANAVRIGIRFMSDATVISCFELCLHSIFSQRGSETLRRESEDALHSLTETVLAMSFDDDADDRTASLLRPEAVVVALKDLCTATDVIRPFPIFVSCAPAKPDPIAQRPLRERLLGLRILTTCLRSLPPRPCAAVRAVVLTQASISTLKNLSSVPLPAPITVSTAMNAAGALTRCLGTHSTAFLFLLLRSVFFRLVSAKLGAVSKEIGQLTFPDVVEDFLEALGDSVQVAFPLPASFYQLDESLGDPTFAEGSDRIAGNLRADTLMEDESESEDGRMEERAVGVMSAKIILDVAESIGVRLKSVEPNENNQVLVKQLREQKGQKKRLRQVVDVFNHTMDKGTGEEVLKLLNSHCPSGLFQSSMNGATTDVEYVVNFLNHAPQLEKAHIGVILGEPDEFSKQVLARYTETFSFPGMSFTDALRVYLESFRLPGESQKIERIMHCFANTYYNQNLGKDGPLSSADAAFVLSYSVVMLNTDQHNESVKKKMTLADFVRNLRGINDGSDLDQKFLEQIFNSIVEEEIRMSDHDGTDALTNAQWNQVVSKFGLHGDVWPERKPPEDIDGSLKMRLLNIHSRELDEDVFRLIADRAVHSAIVLLEEAEDSTEAQEALEGFTLLARCGASFRQTTVVDNIVASLSSQSSLRTGMLESTVVSFGTRIKAQMAAVSLFGVARQSGDWLRQIGWQALIACVLRLHASDLLPTDLEKDLCTYGPDLVDKSGAPPTPSCVIPKWWPSRREEWDSSQVDGKSSKKTNGIWSLFGGGAGAGSATSAAKRPSQFNDAQANPPAYLRLRNSDELKARDLARKCIAALMVEDVIIGETRFLRSDSLACLCSAVCRAVPQVLYGGSRSGIRSESSPSEELADMIATLRMSFEDSSSSPPASLKTNVDSKSVTNGTRTSSTTVRGPEFEYGVKSEEDALKTRESICAFCLDLMCEIILRNRDRLSVTWLPLRLALLHVFESSDLSSPLQERAVVTILRIGIRFLHREEVRNDILSFMVLISALSREVLASFASFLAIGVYQFVKVHAAQILTTKTWRAIMTIVESIAESDHESMVSGMDTLRFITSDESAWNAVSSETFADVARAVAAYGAANEQFTEESVHVLLKLSIRIESLTRESRRQVVDDSKDIVHASNFERFWLPLAQAFGKILRSSEGDVQERAMVVLEQVLSSDCCEATMTAGDWKAMFCDVLVPLLEQENEQSLLKGIDAQMPRIGRTRLRGVMTLSNIFLLQHMKIYKCVPNDEFVEMWTGILRVMQHSARQDVKDAMEYVSECVKNMILVMAASNLLQRGEEPLWSATDNALRAWMPQVMDLVGTVDTEM